MSVTDTALLIVDAQNDFFPGGALPVPDGDAILPALNAYVHIFHDAGWPVFASRDWHPPETTHFHSFGGPWPAHCVQGTPGAAFHTGLALPEEAIVVSKGMGAEEDAYSAFQARDAGGAGLADLLEQQGVRRLYMGGLALDYCVKASALDALAQGLETVVLIDATKAVNVLPHDAESAIEELVRAGARLAVLEQVQAELAA